MSITDVLVDYQLLLDMADVYEEEATRLVYTETDTALDHYGRALELRAQAADVLETKVELHGKMVPAKFVVTEEIAEGVGAAYLDLLCCLLSDTEGTKLAS